MKKRRGTFWKPWRVVLSVLFLLVISCLATWLYLQGKDVAVLDPQGAVGVKEKGLIVFTVLLSIIVVVPVYFMLYFFAWRYRESNHKATYTPDAEDNHWLEAVWWGIPIVIIGILGVTAWITTHELDPHKPLVSDVPAINVQVVALQWKWLFLYPDQHIATVNQLKIPAGTPINFDITADAPMSAFWIPALGTQTYAMTGMSAQLSLVADNPGTYRGTNTNINGKGYSRMDFEVVALKSRRDFDLWAQAVADLPSHNHMEWDEYEELAKPSENNQVAYYHLHNKNLYTEIINKYMPTGHKSSNTPMDMGGKE